MTARIILVRHGPSAHIPLPGWIGRKAVVDWLIGYDGVGIESHSKPPAHLVALSPPPPRLLASDLTRAIESAERFANGRLVETTSLLRELPLAVPEYLGRLPLMGWALLIHGAWLADIVRGRDDYLRRHERVPLGAAWLEQRVSPDHALVAVTHGVMRKYLAHELVSRGWRRAGRTGGYRPWSAWTFTKNH